ncbi:MAG: hypothetical protein KF689_11955 [Gemmatimonadaceae bacterium]|nr:hypothetical protein [Gemmatimonadaceae bacterium]MCW5827307.1 hypothetical protein [Gemmatimonadaceae bacterium]
MGQINVGRMLLGGLVAGVVVNVGETLLNGVFLMDQWTAAREALNAGPEPASALAYYVVYGFLVGLVMVALYASIRPRFGPGAKTAAIAGLFVWTASCLGFAVLNLASGLYPQGLVWTGAVGELVLFPVAAVVGAMVYREDG